MRLITALGLFTVLPVPSKSIDRGAAAGAMAALPLVGIVLGGAAGGLVWAGTMLGARELGAAGGLAVLAAATGGLHLDGLADTADALGSRRPRQEALAIMRRSDIGPMGVVAIVMALLLQFAAVLSIVQASDALTGGLAVLVAPAVGRTAVLFASRGPTARPGGFGSLMAGAPSRSWVLGNAIMMPVLGAGVGWSAGGIGPALAVALAAMVALSIGWLWQRRLVRQFGGTTGDVFGSIIEVSQTVCLSAFAVALHALV